MIEITNIKQGPTQVVVRSKVHLNQFCTLNLAGLGSGRNVYLLEDERMTEFVERAKKDRFISTRYVNTVLSEGE